MIIRFHRWYNAILASLLSLLGYGCSVEDGPVAYGAPHADYTIKGLVTNETGTPVEGVKTSLKRVYRAPDAVYVDGVDSVQTDAEGRYKIQFQGWDDSTMKLIVEDIDGEANGGDFQNDTLDVDFNKAVQTKKGGGWYNGTFEITQNIKLKKK